MSERPPKTVMDRVFDVVGVIMGTFFALGITAAIGMSIYGAVVVDAPPAGSGWSDIATTDDGDGGGSGPVQLDGPDWDDQDYPVDDDPDWDDSDYPVDDDVIGIRVGAICVDGTYSSATGPGACSWHGGVAEWLYE